MTRAHFVVEYTIHAERINLEGNPYRWAQNKRQGILCSTAERAIEMVQAKDAGAVIHVVRRVGTNDELWVDE